MKINLFYSYSHKDSQHRNNMEKHLNLLKERGDISSWHDRNILPGQNISEKIKEKLDDADIVVFLLSADFINSPPCRAEWEQVKDIGKQKLIFRIPIIIAPCSWEDLLGEDDLKVLPKDGTAITTYPDSNEAWKEIYGGIKSVVTQLRKTFTIKPEFLKDFEKTEFISQDKIPLRDIFVFPSLEGSSIIDGVQMVEERHVENVEDITKNNYSIIHGDTVSGKTALCKYIFMSLNDENRQVIYGNLKEIESKKPTEKIFLTLYEEAFTGDYDIWKKQESKTIIFDNMSNHKNSINHVMFAMEHFDNVIVSTSSNKYHSFFKDEDRLAKFIEIKICNLSHVKQEELIKNRLRSFNLQQGFNLSAQIDEIEEKINSVIINNKLLPRYPFYILSILQTLEGFFPQNFQITSHGHCYYVLILTNLIKSGIEKSDEKMNACFNFCENLAFNIYKCEREKKDFDSDEFVAEYYSVYLIPKSLLNRMKDPYYGIISNNWKFRLEYMYYFFLGKFLARNSDIHAGIIEEIIGKSYRHSNSLILLFIIHHINDEGVLDDVLLQTMCALDDVAPAVLDKKETDQFDALVKNIKKDILSDSSIEENRKKERENRDNMDKSNASTLHRDNEFDYNSDDDDEGEYIKGDYINCLYRILKNNDILGQILKTKHGNLKRAKLEEITETIIDSGLRLVKLSLIGKEGIEQFAQYIKEQNPEYNLEKIQYELKIMMFLWTMGNIERIVSHLNKPELIKIVNKLVDKKKGIPAYDLIAYFSRLDSTKSFEGKDKEFFESIYKKYNDDNFMQKILSFRTQHYLNTHEVHAAIRQSLCSTLKIEYKRKFISKDK